MSASPFYLQNTLSLAPFAGPLLGQCQNLEGGVAEVAGVLFTGENIRTHRFSFGSG